MKKIIFFIMFLLPLNVFAYTGAINSYFTIDSQSSEPYHFNINANSSANHVFHIDYSWNHGAGQEYDPLGNYFMVSIVSTQKLSIKRQYNFGSNCSSSCFANEVYLQYNGYNNGSYDYILYFNASKWSSNIGTQIDLYSIADSFTFTNKGSSQATVYFYGAYVSDTNMIPELISNAQVSESVTIMGEQVTQDIIGNQNELFTSDCKNLINTSLQIIKSANNLGTWNNNVYTYNGVTYTINDDLSITIGGTYSSRSYLYLHNYKSYNSGEYFLSGSKYGTINIDVLRNNTYYTYFKDEGNGILVNLPSGYNYQLDFYINIDNANKLNQTIYPQFVLGNKSITYCAYGSTTNKIDDTTNAINDVNNSINDVNNSINNSSIDNPNSDFADMEDMIAQNGVITNLIALPITLYSSILNGLNQSCSEYNFGNLFGTDLNFQCINLGALLGNTIWGVIDVLFSGFTIYAIAKKMIKVFNNFSGLQEGDVIDD